MEEADSCDHLVVKKKPRTQHSFTTADNITCFNREWKKITMWKFIHTCPVTPPCFSLYMSGKGLSVSLMLTAHSESLIVVLLFQ